MVRPAGGGGVVPGALRSSSHVRTSGFRLGIRGHEGRQDDGRGKWEEPEIAIAAKVEGEEKGRDCGGEREKDGMGIMYMG